MATQAQQAIEVDSADLLIRQPLETPYMEAFESSPAARVLPEVRPVDQLSLGLGLGMDYGGAGLSLLYHPHKFVGFFGALGYNLNGAGVNGGIRLRLLSKRERAQVNPFFTAMYGYNAALGVWNEPDLNRTFYGPSFGGGIDFYPGKGRSYMSFGVLIPLRQEEVFEYMKFLESQYGADFGQGLMPIGISIGYRFMLL